VINLHLRNEFFYKLEKYLKVHLFNLQIYAGWGIWHYFIVALCGLLSLAEASTSLTVPIIAPLIACDLKLNRDQAAMPIATSNFGI